METQKPTLYIFSGLPGSGKTTLAQKLCRLLDSCYLRIDTIEQQLRDTCNLKVEKEGYLVAYRLAFENLALGKHVIADRIVIDTAGKTPGQSIGELLEKLNEV